MIRTLVICAALGGCVTPQLVLCEDGRACAPGYACDEVRRTCVHADQLDVCADVSDLTPCSTETVSGQCFDHVCLEPGCGNGFLEVGEVCDDGNRTAFDGCSTDCTSNETCGNGLSDPSEECDDGNLVSHDGCSSGCLAETIEWRTYWMSMAGGDRNRTVWDPTRHRLVFMAGLVTWEWDGTTWTQAPGRPPIANQPYTWLVAVHDPARARVIAIQYEGRAAEWDGTTWQQLVTPAGTGPYAPSLAAYDAARGKTFVLSSSDATAWYFDPVTPAWEAASTLPFTIATGAAIAYDATRQRVVVLNKDRTWEWNGTAWTSSAAVPLANDNVSLTYDAARGKVIGVGGVRANGTPSTEIVEWSGTAWSATGITTPPRVGATVWVDATTIGIVGGAAPNAAPTDQVFAVSASGIVEHTPVQPAAGSVLSLDASGDGLVLFASNGEVWRWDGAWHSTPATTAPAFESWSYDPGRRGTVAIEGQARQTWLYRDNAWQQLAVTATPFIYSQAMTFDFANQRLVAAGPDGTYVLGATDTAWARIADGIAVDALAYDARNGSLVGYVDQFPGGIYDLVNTEWVASLSPGFSFGLVEWLGSGSVILSPSSYTDDFWERRGLTWTMLEGSPMTAAYRGRPQSLSRGRLAMVGGAAGTTALLILNRTSATPDETCNAGEDADADGLAECADADCWWKCAPTCPYQTSCP